MQSILVIFSAALALVTGSPIDSHIFRNEINPFTPQGRIVGGVDITIQEVPYQVLLESWQQGFCGGSIIDESWVLTAGHCIVYADEFVTVRAGSSNRSVGGSVHQVLRSIRHENYSVTEHGVPMNDIALLEIADTFSLDESRQPITLYNSDETVTPGQLSRITGWGTLTQGGRTSDILQTASIPIIDRDVCSRAYQAYGGIPKGQICAAHPAGDKDACQGDSGGPLAVNGKLAGVVSWGNGCAKKGYPGAYTEVAAFRAWIREKTGL